MPFFVCFSNSFWFSDINCIGPLITYIIKKPIDHIRAISRICRLITDEHLGLVMTLLCFKLVVIALWCTRQSQAPDIDRCAPKLWPWPLTLTYDLDPTLTQPLTLTLMQGISDVKTWFFTFDIRPWPTMPACLRQRSTRLQKINVLGQTVQPGELGNSNGRTDGRYQFHNLPASLKLRGR